jgi:hypothetical protein
MIVRFEAFTAVTMKNDVYTRCVDLALTEVLEESIASIFRVKEAASGEPA